MKAKQGMMDTGEDAGGNKGKQSMVEPKWGGVSKWEMNDEGKQGMMDTGEDAGGNKGKQSMVEPKWGGVSKWGSPVRPLTSGPEEPRVVEPIYAWVEGRKDEPVPCVWGSWLGNS
jgi:hypothetical protein